MYRVMIVDDEPYIRKGLKNILNWEQAGFRITSEAHDGSDAFEKLNDRSVDVIITDIRMPNIDGIGLIKKVSNIYPGIKFIVLSAYDDFRYVKEAFKLGVTDYVLKSEMTGEQFRRMLTEFEQDFRMDRLRSQAVRENIFSRYVQNGENVSGEDEQFLRKTGFLTGNVKIGVVAIRICTNQNINLQDILSLFYKIGDEGEQKKRTCLYFKGCFLIFHNFGPDAEWNTADRIFTGFFKDAAEKINTEYQKEIIGGWCMNESEELMLRSPVQRAIEGMENCFDKGRGKLFSYKQLRTACPGRSVQIQERLTKLEELLKEQKVSQDRFDEFAVSGIAYSDIPPAVRRNLFSSYLDLIEGYINQSRFLGFEKIGEEIRDFRSKSEQFGTAADYDKFLRDLFLRLDQGVCGKSLLVKKAVSFLHNNYCRPISVDDIARKAGVTANHLTRIFSMETGYSPTQYLRELRLNRAVSLLQNTDMKISGVSRSVGYENVEHFSRVFKRKYGISPKRYST
ncbi:MAG: response regulator [Spirochaetia bacterium]